MSHLISLTLNQRNRRVINDVRNSHELHRTVMRMVTDAQHSAQENPRAAQGVLFRLSQRGDDLELLVQSRAAARPEVLGEDYYVAQRSVALSEVTSRIKDGTVVAYSAVIAPVLNKPSHQAGIRGTKVPLASPEQAQQWWLTREQSWGLSTVSQTGVPHMRVVRDLLTGVGTKRVETGDRRRIKHRGFRVAGLANVTDSASLISALEAGIGPGKSYGFGLLTVVPR